MNERFDYALRFRTNLKILSGVPEAEAVRKYREAKQKHPDVQLLKLIFRSNGLVLEQDVYVD